MQTPLKVSSQISARLGQRVFRLTAPQSDVYFPPGGTDGTKSNPAEAWHTPEACSYLSNSTLASSQHAADRENIFLWNSVPHSDFPLIAPHHFYSKNISLGFLLSPFKSQFTVSSYFPVLCFTSPYPALQFDM